MGKESHFSVEKPDRHDFRQVIRVNINGDDVILTEFALDKM